jgi:hypothetical protein
MKKITILLYAIIGLFLTGCGDDIPNVALGQKALEAKYEKLDCLKVVDFDKTNGQKSEFGGVLGYEMWFLATIELKSGCYGFYDDKRKHFDYSSPQKERSKYFEQGVENMTAIGYRLVQEGEKVAIAGKLSFSKKENGWEGL